jgi:serine/threonine protein kinase
MEDPVAGKMVTTVCAHCGNVIDVTGLEPGDGITCPYCSKEFSITRQFGNFLLERHLGSGGMGTVFLGHDMTLNREVAVKVLKPELVADHKFMATFLREAEITASLNHPNIVQVYAFGQHENVYYLVVEYISGASLDDKITTLGKVTELEGIEIGIAVARGLECALQRGLIHRDIKPGNILFNANNTPKVVDFGLSLSFETTDHFDGEIWGTPYYVAPEKLERLPEDFRSDLYSLGATLFHAISGRPAYEGEDPNDVAMKHLNGNVVSLKAFVPNISDQTAFAVSKAMARHPKDRYESYAAFISQLEDAKRRITDPRFRNKPKEDVVILNAANSAKYNGAIMMGVVVIIVLLLGTLLWKGSSLFQKKKDKPTADLTDYNPTAVSTADQPAVTPSPPPPNPEVLIEDSGFEKSKVTAPDGYVYGISGSPWTFSGSPGDGSGIVGNGTHFDNPKAPEGVQAAFIQMHGTISQSISGFVPGGTYKITFSAAQRTPFQHGGQSWNVQIDGKAVGSYNPGADATSYVDYSATFTATASTHTLSFVGTDLAGGDNTVFIDNVRITAVSSFPADSGFETPTIGTGNHQYNPSGSLWKFNGASPDGSGIVGNGSGFGNLNAPEGVQAAFVQTHGTITQSISGFVPGRTYTITFSAAERSGWNESWNVKMDDTVIGSYNPGAIATSYVDYTATFTATASTHTLSFVGTDQAANQDAVFIDNVRISSQ